MSFSLIHLGFLMAQGNPSDRKANRQMLKLSKALQKIDLEKRLIENMRHFEGTCLSEPQKLKIYEALLKTMSQVQKGHIMSRLSCDSCPQERIQNWRQKAELQKGAWTGFALLLGAIVASTETCQVWLSQYGQRLGVYLQMQTDFKLEKKEPWVQSSEQIAHELSAILFQMRADLSEDSLAFQYLHNFGLQWTEGPAH